MRDRRREEGEDVKRGAMQVTRKSEKDDRPSRFSRRESTRAPPKSSRGSVRKIVQGKKKKNITGCHGEGEGGPGRN